MPLRARGSSQLGSVGLEFVVADEELTTGHLDATRVTFIDSTGLMILIRARQTAEDHSLTFTLATPDSGPVAHLIGVCGLGRRFAARAC
jgi:anti-anti-sigma factor